MSRHGFLKRAAVLVVLSGMSLFTLGAGCEEPASVDGVVDKAANAQMPIINMRGIVGVIIVEE